MRLIDADALEKEIKEKDIMGGLNYRWYIQNAPTVDVLDKIRAEIENITPKCQIRTGKTSIDTEMMIPQEKVLQIIDKYR